MSSVEKGTAGSIPLYTLPVGRANGRGGWPDVHGARLRSPRIHGAQSRGAHVLCGPIWFQAPDSICNSRSVKDFFVLREVLMLDILRSCGGQISTCKWRWTDGSTQSAITTGQAALKTYQHWGKPRPRADSTQRQHDSEDGAKCPRSEPNGQQRSRSHSVVAF